MVKGKRYIPHKQQNTNGSRTRSLKSPKYRKLSWKIRIIPKTRISAEGHIDIKVLVYAQRVPSRRSTTVNRNRTNTTTDVDIIIIIILLSSKRVRWYNEIELLTQVSEPIYTILGRQYNSVQTLIPVTLILIDWPI